MAALFTPLLLSISPPGHAQSDPVRLRIGVSADGVHRITPADLSNAGIDLAAVDPQTFAMSSLGQPVAIRVTGDSDGSFDSGDYVEFFGEKFRGEEMEEKYTDERVYWLEFGGASGPRILDVDATPQGSPNPPADFADTLHAEENLYWFALHTNVPESKDTWFWEYWAIENASQEERTVSYTVPYPVPTAETVFRIVLNGRAYLERRTSVTINTDPTVYMDETWFGKFRKELSATLPAGLIQHGQNDVHVLSINDNTADGDDDGLYINYWELDYRRLFTAWQGQIDFESEQTGPSEYEIDGWDSADSVVIWKITDPATPTRLLNASTSLSGSELSVRFRAADDQIGDRYWLQTEASILSPASIRERPPTGLRNPANGADTVIVTSPELESAANRLAQWHENHGRRALVVLFQDVIDEFNDGIYHPRAVPAMLAWAQNNWPGPAPSYLILFGDGHWNFKGYNPSRYPPQPQHIPPYLAFSDPWQGEVPVDTFYGDIDGDSEQDLAVGRIPVNDDAEAQIVVAKIEGYNEGAATEDWQTYAAFVADNAETGNDFPADSDTIIANNLPDYFTPNRIYLGKTVPDADAGTAAITDAINRGALLVQYGGHGAPYRWTNESMWTLDDVASLSNSGAYPVMMTFNCLDGYFAHPSPSLFGMAETMLRYDGGGSVAAISSTGLGLTDDQNNFRSLLMDIIFTEGEREVGKVLLATKQRFEAEYGYRPGYLLDTMTLFGDPALTITDTSACTAAVTPTALKIAKDQRDVVLSWSGDAANVRYDIWRFTKPFSEIDTTRDVPFASTTGTSFTDFGSIGVTETNYYYVVTGVGNCGQESPLSKRVGEFDFSLVPGQ